MSHDNNMIHTHYYYRQDVSDAYFGNGSSFSTPFVNTLGRLVSISVEFRNNGPSQIRNAILDISIPVNSAETGNNYYLYPFNLVSNECNIKMTLF